MTSLFRAALGLLLLALSFQASSPNALAFSGMGCGTMCMAQMQGFCPTCGPVVLPGAMPWGAPPPYWWRPGPMMFSNFYSPAPWSPLPRPAFPGMMPPAPHPPFVPGFAPGITPGYYPGSGPIYAAKPNLYVSGPVGTEVSVKVKFIEEGSNWLAAVPVHGREGWKVKLVERNKLQSGQGTYGYLYSDYRVHGRQFQDEEGFCASRKQVIEKIAVQMNRAGFSGREISDFIEYWSVKLPPSNSFCVYPQDERQLETVAPLEVTPAPKVIRRVLFMVQVEEGLRRSGAKFTKKPLRPWNPPALRVPASPSEGLAIREWGVGFFGAEAPPQPAKKKN